MTPSTFPVIPNLPARGIPWKRILQSFVNIFLFLVITAIAIPACLGYRINWQADSITQTGLIELDGPQEKLPMQIYVNGALQKGTFPYRQNWVFPGNYTLLVERNGYQSWTKDVEVDPNMRSTYQNIILIYNQPKSIAPPSGISDTDLANDAEGSDSIAVLDGNELAVNGVYLTSTSQNIVTARWYTDKEHVVYQTGRQLILYDIQSQTTSLLATFSTEKPIPYIFEDGGRVLVYDDNGIKAVTLYEPISFIDRLEAGQ